MATLTRPRSSSSRQHNSSLESHIPSPFPKEILEEERVQDNLLDDLAHEELDVDPFLDHSELIDGATAANTPSIEVEYSHSVTLSQETEDVRTAELLPSLVHVKQSCIMTLNNLLSPTGESHTAWQPILPSRRHSMPARPESGLDNPLESAESSTSALQTLLSNIRNRGQKEMSEASSSSADESMLLNELKRRVDDISSELSHSDARLAQALISLIAHVNRLFALDSGLLSSYIDETLSLNPLLNRTNVDIYDELTQQVLNLQIKRLGQEGNLAEHTASPQQRIETQFLWSKIDQELEAVFDLCRERKEPVLLPYSPGLDLMPPEYDYDENGDLLLPPGYEQSHGSYMEEKKGPVHQAGTETLNDKMKMDLEAVTMAIDRLYLVAPQLHNQRVELRKGKLEELERARLAGPSSISMINGEHKTGQESKGKGKEKDVRELEKILDLVGKAASRRMDNQSVVLEGDMQARIEKAKQRDNAKRDAFVEYLLTHSHSRRIDSQDAIFQPKVRSPDTLLTLPEFIREQVPEEYQKTSEHDPDALLTLPEFMKELPPPKLLSPDLASAKGDAKSTKSRSNSLGKRARSISAPPLAWLIPSLARSPSLRSSQSMKAVDSSQTAKALVVRYVAEHHESLHHVLVFLGVDEGIVPGHDLEAEVLAGSPNNAHGNKLLLKCELNVSAPLILPVPVMAGRADVRVQIGHYEIRLPTATPTADDVTRLYHDTALIHSNESVSRPNLLTAAEITSMKPASFICSSCSLALVQQHTSMGTEGNVNGLVYLDLPSEYWTELIEAWLCHHDQKLHEQVAKHARGFWPNSNQVLVGGSYILFNESAIVRTNLRITSTPKTQDEEWQRVQCICGAAIGRCRSHSMPEGQTSMVYRIAKYALRPVSPTAEPCRTPFSAYILEDMMEFVRAHATYRFIILDEEEERPRLLIWLFKPDIRLAYATTAQYALPKTDSVHAAKVLFKILGPDSMASSLNTILDKYPGFPQAERLLYPIDICHRLAVLLKESNTSYPIGMRVMTGLLVGWLRRA